MKVILDTHTFIWFVNGDKALPAEVRKTISNLGNTCYISIASIWEIAVKSSLGKLELKSGFNKIADFLSENEIEILSISFPHLQKLTALNFHHRDPFDRLIISQALCEEFIVLTNDSQFKKYHVKTFWK